MDLKLVYNVAYDNKKPFSDEKKSIFDFIYSLILVGMTEELAEKKNEISFIGLYLTALENAGLDLNDLRHAFNKYKDESKNRDRRAIDEFLYSNFCDNKLFDSVNKAKKLVPEMFADILPNKSQDINEENMPYSRLLLYMAEENILTDIMKMEYNKEGKYINNKKSASLKQLVNSFYSLNNIQRDYIILTEKIVKKTKIKPEKVFEVMQKLADSCTDIDLKRVQELYKSTPKFKKINKKALSNGVEVSTEYSENEAWKNITKLPEAVIGQDEAVNKVMEKIMGSYVGFQSEKEPVATFLLTGPTGVGKTETAKAVADLCYDGNIFTVDMTTFKNDADISRLLGGSPNYVGYGDPNAFCDFVTEHPQCVLLFDEIDKASKGCLDLLMRMIDEGEFINAKGNVVSLRDAVIICTTNLTEYVEDKTSAVEEKITNIDGLRKEIVGRFSEVVEYKKLSKSACKEIAKKFFLENYINNFMARNEDDALKLEYNDELLDKIVDDANTNLFGARDLKKSIQRNFIAPISKYIIKNNPKNTTIKVGANGVETTNDPISPKAPKQVDEGKGME